MFPPEGGCNVNIEIVNVSPEIAGVYLKNNRGNRPLRPSTVRSIAAMMSAGRWTETHQGIAFDVQGRLVDGQHRLHAIIQAGVSIPLLVTRELPANAFEVIDVNTPRRAADIVVTALHQLGGEQPKRVNQLTAISTIILYGPGGVADRCVIGRYVARHYLSLLPYSVADHSSCRWASLASVAGAFATAGLLCDDRTAGTAFSAYQHPNLTDRTNPLVRLVEMITRMQNRSVGQRTRSTAGNYGRTYCYLAAVAAIRAHRAGRKLQLLKPSTEDFPGATERRAALIASLLEE
jgi:hypothetical protein